MVCVNQSYEANEIKCPVKCHRYKCFMCILIGNCGANPRITAVLVNHFWHFEYVYATDSSSQWTHFVFAITVAIFIRSTFHSFSCEMGQPMLRFHCNSKSSCMKCVQRTHFCGFSPQPQLQSSHVTRTKI